MLGYVTGGTETEAGLTDNLKHGRDHKRLTSSMRMCLHQHTCRHRRTEHVQKDKCVCVWRRVSVCVWLQMLP